VSIQGTLETLQFRELVQMLAFNQKVGTLVLETTSGTRTLHLDRGGLAFALGDPLPSRALLRVVRRRGLLGEEVLERPLQIQRASGRFLGELCVELGILDAPALQAAYAEAVGECLLDLQHLTVRRFEFVEGKCLAPDGTESSAVEPRLPVEALLLDLTRQMDQAAALSAKVPSFDEVYEGTGIEVALPESEDLDAVLAERVLPHLDGTRNLEEVVAASDVDRLSVLRITAALVDGGGLRPVPTPDLLRRAEDLVARGEASSSLPLLRRVLGRPDAPPEVHRALADALEAAGETTAAAEALEEYAGRLGKDDPLPVFDALDRALRLRGRDPVAAARLCDHFLRHRPWLLERRERAAEALRVAVQAATSPAAAVETARRLEEFLANGDAPEQDVVLLADLHLAAGDPRRASGALYRRGEALLKQQRSAEAQSFFRRAVEIDPSRGEARGRVRELEKGRTRQRTNRRVTALLLLLALLVLGAGAGVYFYGQGVERTLTEARRPAEAAVEQAERDAAAAIAEFNARVAAASGAEEADDGLGGAAAALASKVAAATAAPDAALRAFASEVADLATPSQRDQGRTLLASLESRRGALRTKSEAAAREAAERSESELTAGEKDFGAGRFESAHARLRTARNLAFHDAGVRSRAERMLGLVKEYLATARARIAEVEAAVGRDDIAAAYRIGIELLATHMESDATQSLRLPVRVESEPPGAQVLVGGEPTGLVTPCLLRYSPFRDGTLKLRLPGHAPVTVALPVAADAATPAARDFRPLVHGRLEPGVRWRTTSESGRFRVVWDSEGVPVLLTADGARIVPVDPATGVPVGEVVVRGPNPVRKGGSLGRGIDWRFLGPRILEVRTAAGRRWEAQALADLEHVPATKNGHLAIVDAAGTVYGFEIAGGREIWRRTLESPPVHPVQATALGFVVTTRDGSAWLVDELRGSPRRLATSALPVALTVPFGGDVALLGGGASGLRRAGGEGPATAIGDAEVLPDAGWWTGTAGVAWVGPDGVRFAPARDPFPGVVSLPTLGSKPKSLASDGTILYALDAQGVLRACRIDDPGRLLWSLDLGGTPGGPLVLSGDALFVAVDDRVVAVER
jgi:tetratricopeptide (TPR) repeat protein